MRERIKVELWRALCSRGMLTAFFAGLGIVLWHQYQYVWNPAVGMENGLGQESLYYKWIGASSFPMQSYLFYLVLPILAAIPAGASYYDDLRSGYYRSLYLRNQKREYLTAKYLAVFTAGGLAVVLPLIISLYLTAMRFPALVPEPIMSFGPNRKSVGHWLYYTHPMLHTLLFLLIDFLFAGGIAGISLLTTFFTNYRFATLITPFVCYYFVFTVDSLLGSHDYSPNYFLMPGFWQNNIWLFVVGIGILLLAALLYFWKGRRLE